MSSSLQAYIFNLISVLGVKISYSMCVTLNFSGGDCSPVNDGNAAKSESSATGGGDRVGDFSRPLDIRQGVMAGINEINEEVSVTGGSE